MSMNQETHSRAELQNVESIKSGAATEGNGFSATKLKIELSL